MNDINNILEECEAENNNEKKAAKEIKKIKELNLRTLALNVQLDQTKQKYQIFRQERKSYESQFEDKSL